MDSYSRTNVPSIWAIGDVTDRIALTPVALMEGMALAKTLVLNQPTEPDYWAVASAVFSYPEIATVVSKGGDGFVSRHVNMSRFQTIEIPDSRPSRFQTRPADSVLCFPLANLR